MFYSPKLFFKDRWIFGPLIGSVLLQLFVWWYILANIRPTTEQIFLHYNVVFGVDLIGEWWKIYYLPIAGLLVMIVNYVLGLSFYRNDKLLSRVLSFFVLFFHAFLVMAIVLIVDKNI